MTRSLFDDDYDDLFKPAGRGRKGSQSGVVMGPRCHDSHPALKVGGGTLLGGNCRDHKRHEHVDLYVALDPSQQHPYFEPDRDFWDIPVSVYYPIQNMKVPTNVEKFAALIGLIRKVLSGGGTVHVGCIGGHGRTGLVLAAVVACEGITDDPIAWVREHYCKKAVESREQEGFLAVNYDCPLPPPKKPVDKRAFGY